MIFVQSVYDQCENRFKNLSSTFRSKMDKENRSGASSQRPWEYMDIMLDIYDQKANVYPKNVTNGGDLPGRSKTTEDQDEILPSSTLNSSASKKKIPEKRPSTDDIITLFKEAQEERRRDSER